jgi:hypothetical protein
MSQSLHYEANTNNNNEIACLLVSKETNDMLPQDLPGITVNDLSYKLHFA